MRNKGFTLIEVLAVGIIFLMGVLMLVGGFSKYFL